MSVRRHCALDLHCSMLDLISHAPKLPGRSACPCRITFQTSWSTVLYISHGTGLQNTGFSIVCLPNLDFALHLCSRFKTLVMFRSDLNTTDISCIHLLFLWHNFAGILHWVYTYTGCPKGLDPLAYFLILHWIFSLYYRNLQQEIKFRVYASTGPRPELSV